MFGPHTHAGDLDEVPGSQLQPGLALAIGLALSLSLCTDGQGVPGAHKCRSLGAEPSEAVLFLGTDAEGHRTRT